ncbi:Sugar phosphate exchanger 3 [Stylophora pistillata]|uniref:Sugar phosphate exchanger 3 n=1 Tax=Stylophora pistillata TaxID=50429 RepID=A0A2B4SJJ7_STYPI|nr:Sugar phosphate exchanger 3 [Stylophora pistillata]
MKRAFKKLFPLDEEFGWKDTVADKISTFYDVGGIVGGIIGGLISDLMSSRSPLVIGMLVLSVPMLFIYGSFMVGGPANLISSAISADLGRQSALSANSEALATVTGIVDGTGSVGAAIGQSALSANSEALATVTGIVDGTGSVGAAIGQFLVPEINTHSGWKPVFYFLMVMTFMSFVCLIIPILIKKIRERRATDGYYQVSLSSDSAEYPPSRHINGT